MQTTNTVAIPEGYSAHGFYLDEPTNKPLEKRLVWLSQVPPTTEMLQHVCDLSFKRGYDTVLICFADGSTHTIELW